MIDTFVIFLQNNLLPLGALGVFIASLIEEVIAPIPSAIVLIGSGFLLLSGPLSLEFFSDLLFKVAIPASLGMSLGSLFVYGLSFAFGKPAISRWGKWFALSWDDIETSREKFSKGPKDEITLFTVRALPFVPSVAISAFAGLVRFPIKPYLIYSFLGTLVRAIILGFFGSRIGSLYFLYAEQISEIEGYILKFLVIGALAFVLYRFWKSRSSKKGVLK